MENLKRMESLKDLATQEYLRCIICLELAEEALESLCCHNIYCESCVIATKLKKDSCPTCRKNGFSTAIAFLARKMINALPVNCSFGCGTTVPLLEMKTHKNKCLYHIYSCSNIGCEFKGNFDNYTDHIIKFHTYDAIQAFDELNLRKRFCKRGKIVGYYKQGDKEHVMTGTYVMENSKLFLNTQDEVGVANWEGEIDITSGKIHLSKKYSEYPSVEYTGLINHDLNKIIGTWNIGHASDEFQLELI